MSEIKYFGSFSDNLERDCELVHKIFNNEIYLDIDRLKSALMEISQIYIEYGVVYTLVAKSDYFKIHRPDFLDLLTSIENKIDGDLDLAYDKYVEAMQKSVRTQLFDYFRQPGDLTLNTQFIEFIKALSPYELQIVKEISLENEIYELIILIDSVRNI